MLDVFADAALPWWGWLCLLALGVVVAQFKLWQDQQRRLAVLKPSLRIIFDPETTIYRGPGNPRIDLFILFQVQVVTDTPLGVENVQVRLKNIEQQGADGKFVRSPRYTGGTQAFRITATQEKGRDQFTPLPNLTKDDEVKFDILMAGSNTKLIELVTHEPLIGYREIFAEPGEYRITIFATGKGVVNETAIMSLRVDEQWDKSEFRRVL